MENVKLSQSYQTFFPVFAVKLGHFRVKAFFLILHPSLTAKMENEDKQSLLGSTSECVFPQVLFFECKYLFFNGNLIY